MASFHLSSKVKPCKFRGCQVSFSKADTHSDCYYHRVCDRTRDGGNPQGKACLECKLWDSVQMKAFSDLRKIREQKKRERASKAKATAASLYSPRVSRVAVTDVSPSLSLQKVESPDFVGPLTFAQVVTSPPRTTYTSTAPRPASVKLLQADVPTISTARRLIATPGSGVVLKTKHSHKKSKKSRREQKDKPKKKDVSESEKSESEKDDSLAVSTEKPCSTGSSDGSRQTVVGSETAEMHEADVTFQGLSYGPHLPDDPVVVAVYDAVPSSVPVSVLGRDTMSMVSEPVSSAVSSLMSELKTGDSIASSAGATGLKETWSAGAPISSEKASGVDLQATLLMIVEKMSTMQSEIADIKSGKDAVKTVKASPTQKRNARRRRSSGSKRRRTNQSPVSRTGSRSSADSISGDDRTVDDVHDCVTSGESNGGSGCDSGSGAQDRDRDRDRDRDHDRDHGLDRGGLFHSEVSPQSEPVNSDEVEEAQLDELEKKIKVKRAELRQRRAEAQESFAKADQGHSEETLSRQEQDLLELLARGAAAHQRFVPPPQVTRTTLSPSSGLPKEVDNLGFTIPKTAANRTGRSPKKLRLDQGEVRVRSRSPVRQVSFVHSPRKDISPLRGSLARLVDPRVESRRTQSEPRLSSPVVETTRRSRTPGGGVDMEKFIEKNDQSFREDIKLLFHLDSSLEPTPASADVKVPECLEGAFDSNSKTRLCLPVHSNLDTWYRFARVRLGEVRKQVLLGYRRVAYEPSDFLRKTGIYDAGVDGLFLKDERTPPYQFTEISSLKQSADVKKLMTTPTTFSNEQCKAMERSARTGLAAGSYGLHFMDGANTALKELKQQIDSLAPPEQCSANTRKAVDSQRDMLLDSMTKVQSFLGRAQLANNIAFGMHTLADVNLTLARRDKFVSKLPGYLKKHAFDIRNSRVDNLELIPNLDEIVLKAREDAKHEQTRRLAGLDLGSGKGSKGQQQQVQRGQGQNRQGQGQGRQRQGQGQGQGRNRNNQRSNSYDRGYDQEYRRDYQARGRRGNFGGRGRGRSQNRDRDRRSRSRSREKETK